MNRRILIGLVALLATNSLLSAEQPAYKPGVVLVRFANEPNATAKSAILNSALGRVGSSVRREYTLVKGLTQVSLPTGVSVESAVASLKQSSSILYAEPDYRIELCAIPNDTRFGELWGMRNIGQAGGTPGADISAPEAWDINTGSKSIVVAVTDTGVDYTHPDLSANMWVNPGEIPGNGIDDDLDGFIDDVYGCDTGDNDGNPMDVFGHGTHVSGTIGAVGNNNRGVVGVCWHVKIMAVKIFTDAGTETLDAFVSNAVEGIQYATAKGARVINASWRLYNYSQILYDTIAAARNAGVLFVAAAGNETINNDLTPPYPTSYDLANIISVMATTNTDQEASFSNYGLTSVDIGAPGQNILSTLPGNQYDSLDGTSMASPHVAGACALLLSIDPTLTYSQVKQILLDTVDPTLPGLCVSGGRLNLAAAAQEVATDTTPPTPNPAEWDMQPQATGLHTVTMKAKVATDRSDVNYYFECVNPEPGADTNSGWVSNTLYSFTTLSPGTIYGFRFRARDKSDNHNQTDWSTTVLTMTAIGTDTLPAFPDPPRWAIKPRLIRPNPPMVRMQAETAYDESGVEYLFEETTGTGIYSDWQDSTIFTVTSPLTVGHTYTFQFTVRDKSAVHNETTNSEPVSVHTVAGARILKVPSVYGFIQAAIDDAVDGDIVEISPYPVPPYTYQPLLFPDGSWGGNINVHFNGKAITVRSIDPMNPDIVASTIIDCEGTPNPNDQRRAFIFDHHEGSGSILAGLTIRNGYVKGRPGSDGADGTQDNPPTSLDGGDGSPGSDAFGGAILCVSASSPTIRNCVIENCVAAGGNGGNGGNGADGIDFDPGVPADPCDPNVIEIPPTDATRGGNGGNGAIVGIAAGGAIFSGSECDPVIQNCIIRSCRVLPGTPGTGNGGNGGDGGTTEGGGQMPGGNAGNGGSLSDVRGGGICTVLNNTQIIGCTIEDCNAFNAFGLPGQPGMPGTGTPMGQNGVPGNAWCYAKGGGVYSEMASDAIISSTNFLRNQVGTYGTIFFDWYPFSMFGGHGGGFYGILSGTATITMSDCNFIQNSADINRNGYGGGIYLSGSGWSNLILRNCNIVDNTAGINGGGAFVNYSSTDIHDSAVTGNNAPYGGGMLFANLALTVQDSNFLNNVAQEGGAAFIYDCSVSMSSSQITGNSAVMPPGSGLEVGFGGGLASWQSYGQITNCLMSFNSADAKGGAAFTEGLANSPLQFINCLITDNTAVYDGGGLTCKTWAWTQLINCTIANNSSTDGINGSGGGVSCAEDWAWLEIINSILWDNSAAYGPQIGAGTRFGSLGDPNVNVDVSYSDVEGGEDQVFLQEPDVTVVWWLDGSFDADPLFANTDISEQTYYLSYFAAGQEANSPCINVGSADANDPAINLSGYTTRTDGVADTGIVDVGYHYVAGQAKKYPLTIEVYEYDPIEGGHGRLNAKTTPQNDNQFDINDPNTIQVSQGTVVNLTAFAEPNFRVWWWSGTDNDGSTAATNTVTMNSNKRAIVAFEPNGYYLTVTVIGNGTVTPAGRTLHAPGEVVTLTATPDSASDVIIWRGTDNDASAATQNTVFMYGHRFVTVEFYTPRILYVGGNSGYPTIQAAIDDAHDRDTIILMPSEQPYYTQEGFTINGRNITITSINPNDPAVVASTVIQQRDGPEGGVSPAFWFQNVGPLMRLQGITIRGFYVRALDGLDGQPPDRPFDGAPGNSGIGMGIYCNPNASPTIENCVIDDCHSAGGDGGNGAGGTGSDTNVVDIAGGNGGWPGAAYGGGVTCLENSNPAFINCTFSNNSATGGNGGDGGNGNDDPAGDGGRGGGWYYGYPLSRPWYFGLPFGEEPRFYSGLGGAVFVGPYCSLTFESCAFINNTTAGGLNGISGQIGFIDIRPEPTIRYKIDNLGGAVYLFPYSAADFNNCEFIGNTADTNKLPDSFDGFLGFGGAVAADYGATTTFRNCSFSNNTSDVGGGVYSLLSHSEVINSNFADNNATHGGGLLFTDSIAYIAGSTFSGNLGIISGSDGGAIGLLGTNAEIADCNIINNRVGGSGGGIYISSKNVDGSEIEGDNSVLVKNCLITGNIADLDGGGISANWYSNTNVVNCTIANNTSTIGSTDTGLGGGLYCSYNSYVNILNSIIWGNLGATGAQLAIGTGFEFDPWPSTADVTYSVIGPSRDVVTIEPAEALTINVTNAANVLASTILGPGINVVGQPQYTGAATAAGTFVGGLAAGIGIESGIILTSGDANNALPPNKSDGITGDNNLPGDPDLDVLLRTRDVNAADVNTYDATVLEFSFTTRGGNLFFNFVFASDEYNEFVNSQFNDVFGFFLDGTNIALIPGTTTPVAINNVNGGNPLGTNASNPGLFHNNDLTDGGPFFDIEYDGFTNVFTAQAFNVGSGTHTIKLAIADTADRALDSAVFIQAGSFSDKPSYSDPIYVNANCTLNGWAPDPNNPWEPGTHNLGINANPLFVDGYFLSQIAAGQLITSPCVDTGSADVNAVDMNNNTTRTDGYADAGIVDMGYHYPLFTAQQYSLTIEVDGVGGRLLAQGKGDNAFTIKDPNTLQVNAGTVVSLQALANVGYAVSRWTGTDDDASTDPNNTVTMDSDKVVKVEFHQYQLTIEVMGADGYDPNGRLVATGTGADPFTLQAREEPNSRGVKPGRVVNLKAFPDDNFRVRVWTGTDNDASTSLTNTVTMNSDKTVVVGFEPNGLYYLTVTVIGNGTVEPIGRYLHTPGDVVTITATPDNPADAIIWTGTDDDYSTARQNTVTMNGHKDVTVEFYAPRVLYVGSDTGFPTIQLAIDAANNRDIVMITPGIYNIYESSEDRPYLFISGKDIKLTSTNPEDANATQIIGGFIIENASRNLIIEGLTISAIYWKDYENGSVIGEQNPSNEVHWGIPLGSGIDGYGGGTCRGAGMQLNDAASPTVRNCRFVNCEARGIHGATGAGGTGLDGYSGNGGPGGKAFGGGAYCGLGGSPLFEDCSFINCSARSGDAGNGGSAAPAIGGHGGAWGDNNAVWWEYPLEEFWKYSGYGGAIYCDVNNTAEFRNCTFTGNSTVGGSCGISGAIIPSGWPSQHYKIESFGGAVYAASGSAPQFVECNFTNNEANMQGPPTSRKDNVATVNAYPNISFGGAVAFEDGAAPVFEKCTFNGNRATVGGGAFAAWSQGTVTDCNFEDNTSYHGGGILFVGGTSEIVNSRFTGNQSTVSAAQGGAITLLGADAEVSDCNIWDNTSAGSGGGIYISSRDVGGNELPGGNSVLIRNCLITGNSAGQNGAGISANWHSDPNIVNCTIAGNIAVQGMGGGLYSAYNNYTQIINSIFWDNTAPRGPQIAVGTTVNPAYVKVTYSDVEGGVVDVYLAPRTILEWDVASSNPDYPTNIHIDPCFTSGPRGDFYLSQVSSGQPKTSPCVDAGSDLASTLGFTYYTTRTDEAPDRTIVDMGYHYPLLEPCRFSDLVKDGIINFFDLAIVAESWLNEGCADANHWCGGADLTFDTYVGLDDLALVTYCWLAQDTFPPLPNPSQWEIEPLVGDNNSVTMRAAKTQDILWGLNVEYYFRCESGDCHDSGWQTNRDYNDGNLMLSTEYGYKAKARDTAGNETEWSLTRYVTTGGAPGADTNAPTPNPMTWATPVGAPYALSATSVAMVAATAIDASGAVYYQFAESNGIPSNWQTDPCYVATGLDPNIEHCYTVRARDRYGNTTGWSNPPICVSPVPPDSIAPSPEPIMIMSDQNYLVPNIPDNNSACGQFQTNGYDWWHKVMVNVTGITDNVDGTHVEIRFICLTDNNFSSTSKISGPIYLDGWARGDTGVGHARVTYIGTDYVVYDVDINKFGGTGKTLNWEVCVNDAAMNTTCSDIHTLGPP
jgi:subtilisin family serine protease